MMKRAFTLIELVVVLAALAIVAHLAVRELAHFRASRLENAAMRQLEEIRDAVWSVDSHGEAHGFLADMGRLPRELDELWELPAGAQAYSVTNVASGVYAASGWRGPYIRLGTGRDRLLDPWGNEFSMRDSAGLARVFKDDEGFVTNICHYGESAQASGRRDMSLVPHGGRASRLVVTSELSGEGSVTCYWPDGDGALASEEKSLPATFEGIPPGLRTLHIDAAGMRSVSLIPGDNLYIVK